MNDAAQSSSWRVFLCALDVGFELLDAPNGFTAHLRAMAHRLARHFGA